MRESFDPYRKWLGIPPKYQPPNHYRLLGVERFEDDPDVIEAAADQRMAHVRNYQTGQNSALSQKILNELSAAKICLLDAHKKSAYDEKLRGESAVAMRDSAAGPSTKTDGEELLAAIDTGQRHGISPSLRGTGRKRRPVWHAPAVVAAGMLLVVSMVVWLSAKSGRQVSTQTVAPSITQSRAAAGPPAVPAHEVDEKVENARTPGDSPAQDGGETKSAVSSSDPTPMPAAGGSGTDRKVTDGQQGAPDAQVAPNAGPQIVDSPPPGSAAPASVAASTEAERIDEGTRYAAPKDTRAAAPTRLALPSADALGKAERLIRETYERELAGDDKAAAARALLAAVAETSDPSERAALISTAADLSARAGDLRLTFDAHETLARYFVFDAPAAKIKTLEEAARTVRANDARIALVNGAMDLIDELSRAARYDLGERAAKAAQTVAARVKDPALRKQVANKRADLEKQRKLHDARERVLAQARRELADDPDDASANETLGKYLCFEMNDWPAGLKHLAKSSQGKLRDAALADLESEAEAERQLAVGDNWWDLAEVAEGNQRPACRRRAAFWYVLALPKLTGLMKTRAEKRVEDAGPIGFAGPAAGDDKYVDIVLAPKTTLRLVRIPASSDGRVGSFYLGQTELTQRQWIAVMGAVPWEQQARADDLPIAFVAYDDCQAFVDKLNQLVPAGPWRFRLPSKEEFAYCFLAGQQAETAYQPQPTKYGWLADESSDAPHAVAGKQANAFALRDILGNVWEWTSDCRYYGMAASDRLGDNPRLALALTSIPPPRGQEYKTYRGWNLGLRIAADAATGAGPPARQTRQ
ncbi:MAG TPA: SUMF1/EgtB/PvdO family nonheme iron enzyme [Pirellulales bacterium]|nr:SUMF1/EgtB/PvdO family nonheme iron enzyme [Pirellulales bacterium]